MHNTWLCTAAHRQFSSAPSAPNGGSGASTMPKGVSRNVTASSSARSAAVCRVCGANDGSRPGPGAPGCADAAGHAARYEQHGEQEPQDAPPGVGGAG
jgi:hypothetical protein